MSIPKEPRQMMINMMYLVLTALLAMNVSAEILNAFHTVNRGITNSNRSVDSKLADISSTFQTEYNNDPKRVAPLKVAADSTHAQVQRLVTYIEGLKNDLITASGGWTDTKGVKHTDGKTWREEDGTLEKHDDLESTTRLFIEDEKAPQAPVLEKKIRATRKAILSNLEANDTAALAKSIPLRIDQPLPDDEGATKSWEDANFHMVPTIATLTLLNKFINDAKNSEAQINEHLINKITQKIIRVDALQGKIISPSSYVMEGQTYKAQIFVAASSSSQDPTIWIGGLNSSAVKDKDGNYAEVVGNNPVVGGTKLDPSKVAKGVGMYEAAASGDGMHKLTGALEVNDNGTMKYYPFETDWQSAKPAVVISPEKMNVIYMGIDNPVAISAPGVPADKIKASITVGNINPTANKGHYNVFIPIQNSNSAVINVNAEMSDKSVKKMGDMTFRVKRIPDPNGALGNLKPGCVSSSNVKAQAYVLANLEGFEFDARFQVLSYSMTYAQKRQDLLTDNATGSKVTDRMAQWLAKAKPGDMFYIDDIRAKGPDGVVRKLSSVAYKVCN